MDKTRRIKTPQWVVENNETINRTKTIENIKTGILEPLLNARKDLDNLLSNIKRAENNPQIKILDDITKRINLLKTAAEETKKNLESKRVDLENIKKTFMQYSRSSANIVADNFVDVANYINYAIGRLDFKISSYNHYLELRKIYKETLPAQQANDMKTLRDAIEKIEKKYDDTFLSIAKWFVENFPSTKPLLAQYLSEYNKINNLRKKGAENIDALYKKIDIARDQAFKEGKKQLEGLEKDEKTRFTPTQFFND